MRATILTFFAVLACAAADVEMPASQLEDKLRGGLLGHILGDLNGLPHEMKYIQDPGNVGRYVPSLTDGAWTDDDTDIEWVYLVEAQRSGTILLTPARMAALWKAHINRRIWCSHLYLRQLLDIGIEPPLTGSVHLNPWAAFNLSGQFASESWALIAPGMPQTAARIGTHYTHVSVDGEPIQATQMFTAMIASAYLMADVERIVDAGVAATDPRSRMRQVALDIRRWHRENPADWRAARKLLRDKYAVHGGQDMRDRNGVILNGASTVAALLYGRGDWVETAKHAFNFGWDADNNAATAGTIVGVIKGRKWMLDQGWQVKDVFRNTSRDNMPEDETITRFGDRLMELAGKVVEKQGGKRIATNGRNVFRIPAETAANIERLPDPKAQFEALRSSLRRQIEDGVAAGASPQQQARAAYLAICLDLAAELRQKHAEKWTAAVSALSRQSGLMQALYFESPLPAAAALRAKAEGFGLAPPARREKK